MVGKKENRPGGTTTLFPNLMTGNFSKRINGIDSKMKSLVLLTVVSFRSRKKTFSGEKNICNDEAKE